MLSRIAESFFWLGRYVERAEATARLLAEHHQLLVEDRSVPDAIGCRALLEALSMSAEGVESPVELVRVVVGHEADPSTIAGAVSAARTNARAIRDSLSQDTFEALNSAHLALSRGMAFTASPGVALHRVLERLLVVNGIVDWTMPRDEAYHFMVLGRELERIDMVGRLMAIRHDQLWPSSGPAATLRAAAALSPFLRTGRPIAALPVRTFLVLDPAFPRSMRVCAADAEEAVRGLYRSGVSDSGQLLREVGMLRSELEYASLPTPEDIEKFVGEARSAAVRAGDEVYGAFFRPHGTIVWSH
ncbi:MAG: alpha-E domain-containing protein [Actinomycetota bacterium]|nr:alpha-E domain-containing protein [Actinomycetota bacterium]